MLKLTYLYIHKLLSLYTYIDIYRCNNLYLIHLQSTTKGKLSHDQLSQLLLIYIGTAADIVEFFDAFKEKEVTNFHTTTFNISNHLNIIDMI